MIIVMLKTHEGTLSVRGNDMKEIQWVDIHFDGGFL